MSICQEIWSLGGSHTVKNHVATITKNLQPISDTFTSSSSHVKSSILWNKMVSLQNWFAIGNSQKKFTERSYSRGFEFFEPRISFGNSVHLYSRSSKVKNLVLDILAFLKRRVNIDRRTALVRRRGNSYLKYECLGPPGEKLRLRRCL